MKKTKLIAAFCGLFAVTNVAQADVFQDTDWYFNTTGQSLRLAVDGSNDPISGTPSSDRLSTSTLGPGSSAIGFTNPPSALGEAGVWNLMVDDGDALGAGAGDAFGFIPGTGTSLLIEFSLTSSDPESEEVIFQIESELDENFTGDVFNTTVAFGNTIGALATLNTWGDLAYDVYVILPKNAPQGAEGSVRLNWARATVTTPNVPEGGFSLSLLGLSLLGLAGAKRRFAK